MENDVLQRLRTYLRAKEISTKRLSEQIGTNVNTLAGKIAGNRGLDLDTLCSILEAEEGLSAEWLFRGIGDSTSNSNDRELKEICISQARKIYQLEKELQEIKSKKETGNASSWS